MQALRGPDNALADLSGGKKEGRTLLARLDGHFRRELELWAATEVDAVAIRDAVGTAAVRSSSRLWRQVLKPLYRDYCQILHDHDKFAFFSSEGKVAEFFNDLIEAGFDAIYTAVPTVDLEQLAKECRRRVTFWLDPGVERLLAAMHPRRCSRGRPPGPPPHGFRQRRHRPLPLGPRHAASQRDRLLRGVDDFPARRGVRGGKFGIRKSEFGGWLAAGALLRIPTSDSSQVPAPSRPIIGPVGRASKAFRFSWATIPIAASTFHKGEAAGRGIRSVGGYSA